MLRARFLCSPELLSSTCGKSNHKLTLYFYKVFLGVNKRSPNAASRNKLGRLPLKLQITQNIVKYWFHLEGLQKNSIASLCLEIYNKMAEENKQCLTNKVNHTLGNNNIDKSTIYYDNPSVTMSKIKNSVIVSVSALFKESSWIQWITSTLFAEQATKLNESKNNENAAVIGNSC